MLKDWGRKSPTARCCAKSLYPATLPVRDEKRLQSIGTYAPPLLMTLFFIFTPLTQHSAVREICLYGSALFWFYGLWYRKAWNELRTPLTLPFLLIFLWIVAGVPSALNKPNTIHDIYAHWVKYVLLYYLVLHCFQKASEFNRLLYVVIFSGAIYSAWYIYYFYIHLGHPWSDRLVLFPYREYYFVFASMLAVGLVQQARGPVLKLSIVAALGLVISGAVLSQFRNAVFAIAVGSFVFFLQFRKAAIILILAMILVVASFSSLRERLSWQVLTHNDRVSTNLLSLEILKDHPLFGIGFGMRTYGYNEYIDLQSYFQRVPERLRHDGPILETPHNLLMDVAVRTGIPGGLLWLFLYYCEGIMLIRLYRRSGRAETRRWALVLAAAFTAFLAQSLFTDAAFGVQAIVFFTILALTSILWRWHLQELSTRAT